MANYSTLKAAIQQVIKANGNNEITGDLLQQSLLAMINSLGAGYQFIGVATPSTDPGTPDQRVCYIGNAGTYTNFNASIIPSGSIGLLLYDNNWRVENISLEELVNFVLDAIIGGGGSGEIPESAYPKTGIGLISNGKYTASQGTNSILIPLVAETTYTLTFANGFGGYTVVLDATIRAGQTANLAPGYSGIINTSRGDIVTLVGVSGQYLLVRADPVSAGRVYPTITYQGEEPLVVLRSQVKEEPQLNSNDVVSSGGLYNIFSQINSILEEIDNVLPHGTSGQTNNRQDVPISDLTFVNKTPGGATNNKRVISNTIQIPSHATGFHIKCAAGYLVIAYYLRANGTWDSNVQSSGDFAQNADLGAPQYDSGGVWVYFRNTTDTALTPAQVSAAITEIYFDVPEDYLLPVASKELAQKSISILFIGNSLTQDAVSYVPYLLRSLYPNVDFRFYMWYNGGYTLAQHYTKFVNNQPCEIFSLCENTTGWTNYNNTLTMQSVLQTYKFDIVCLQEYFNYKTTYTETDLDDFNNCLAYIRANYNRNFKVVTLFHAPLRSSADAVFERTKAGNELILKKTIAESIMAPGVAIYRALFTTLDSLGDRGHLSPDGTHAQEGLPCLLEAFVVFIWIMRQLAIPISIANCQLRMTTTVYNSINVPGPNLGTGVIPGTDAENNLAQDVAILADKEGCGMLFESFIGIGQ